MQTVLPMLPCLKERAMMSQQRRATYMTSIGALFLCLLVGMFLFARRKRFSKPTPSTEVTKHNVETSPEDTLAYWTADKIRDAKPAPLPVVDEPQQRKRPSRSSRPNQN